VAAGDGSREPIEFLSAVLLVSANPQRLAEFSNFTQLVDAWFEQIEWRRSQGQDVVARWRARRP